jgi:hypothetical protein
MSAFGGSNISTNGLVLCLDAANIKSYSSGSTWFDISGTGNNGSIKAGVTYKTQGWFDFNHLSGDINGYNGYIDVGNPVSLQLSSDITIETWINPDSTTGLGNMVCKNGNTGFRYRVSATGQLTFIVHGAANILSSAAGLVQNGAWSHCVVTGDSSGLKAYVNGVLVASNSIRYAPPAAQTNNLTVGIDIENAERFDGKIAICKIYNRALTATEIKQSYDTTRDRFVTNTFSTIARAAPGLICALDPANLDSWTSGGSALIDLTGNARSFAATDSDFATYNGQNVLRLDGNTVRTITGLNITLPYTILGISRYNGVGSNARARTIASNSNNWLMNHWKNNKSRYFAMGWVTTSAELNNADNNWQIGIVTGATGDYHAYFDGTTDSAVTPAGGAAAPGPITLGGKSAGSNSEPSNCDIGLFLVWNRVLTQTEINTVYSLVRQRFGQ